MKSFSSTRNQVSDSMTTSCYLNLLFVAASLASLVLIVMLAPEEAPVVQPQQLQQQQQTQQGQ